MTKSRVRRIFVLLVVLAAAYFAFEKFENVTFAWDEEVTLLSGDTLQVRREVIFGPDEWFQAGRGRMKEQSMTFSANGAKVRWKNNEDSPSWRLPDLLELANGMPVIVMPVDHWELCFKYDFPREGIVAFGYHDGTWKRIPLQTLPAGIKVNLLRSARTLRASPDYRNQQIDAQAKALLDNNVSGAKQGATLSESSNLYSELKDSCARLKPLPDPQLEAARQRSLVAERDAPSIAATLASIASDPQTISAKEFAEQKGRWTEVGYLSPSCKDVVEKPEVVHEWSGDAKRHAMRRVGYQLTTTDAPKQIIQVPANGVAQMQGVFCDPTTIYVVRRQDKEHLILHRFRRDGDLIDAFRVVLPDTSKITPGTGWGTLWFVRPDNTDGNLAITIADYAQPQTSNLVGTINRMVNYVVSLPLPPHGSQSPAPAVPR